MAITVAVYGIHHEWLADLHPELRRQFGLADDLWNDLVAVNETHEAARAAVWSSYPAVAAAETAVAAADALVEDLAAKVAEARKQQRTKRPNHPAVKGLAAARKQLREARQARRDAIGEARDDAMPRLRNASDDALAAQKNLYRKYTSAGMYWATFNDISRRRFTTAVKRVGEARAAGRPAQLRRRRPGGTGTIAVQLQRQTGDPARTPARIADATAGKWRNVLVVPWIPPADRAAGTRGQQRAEGRVTIRIRAGQDPTDGPVWIDVPVQAQASRSLPADADIAEARLSVWRVGPDLRGHVTVVAKIPDPVPVTGGPTVALHLGWRGQADGGVRVATWRATAPLDVPFRDVAAGIGLRDVLHLDPGGLTGTVVLPGRVDDRIARLDKGRSRRDDALNAVKARLVEWVEANEPLPNPYDDTEAVTVGKLAQWRSPARFVTLGRHLGGLSMWDGTEPHRLLADWACQDRLDWRAMEHGRRRVLAHRDDLWANVAAVIATQAGRVVVDDSNVADLSRVPDVPRDDSPPAEALEGVARRRVIAAPGELRARLVVAAEREGVPVVKVPAKDLSREHGHCGYLNTIDGHVVCCGGCGRTYDVDANATALMVRRASAPVD